MPVQDRFIATLIDEENRRHAQSISLIASENYADKDVISTLGSVFTNKYAEGYPGKRYYAGCETVDILEETAITRCKELFSAEHANVQPHSGSQANMAAYLALLQPGESILGMGLASGGHITHGQAFSFSGMFYTAHAYHVQRFTELIDYDALEKQAHELKPRLIIAGASSYSRIIDFKRFRAIADSVGAFLLVDAAHTAGLIATALYPNPTKYADVITATTHKTLRGPRGGFILCKKALQPQIDKAVFPGIQGGPFMNVIAAKAVTFYKATHNEYLTSMNKALAYAQQMVRILKERGYRIVSDGTDTHLFVIDLRNKKISGIEAEQRLERVGIFVSRSLIPFDTAKPLVTSGIRIGTLALTSRGYTEADVNLITEYLDRTLTHELTETQEAEIKLEITSLNQRIYEI